MNKIEFLSPSGGEWSASDPEKVMAVMFSGGLDSTVTASLMLENGFDVCAFTMDLPVLGKGKRILENEHEHIISICNHLKIPHYFLRLDNAFIDGVIHPFRQAYKTGMTPSPCVICNKHIKFGSVMDAIACRFGVHKFATGHYARIVRDGADTYLARGLEHSRDQSYFIYSMPRKRLKELYFPLGDIPRAEVRSIAHERGLMAADRASSMELCFAGESSYKELLGDDIAAGEGLILNLEGRQLGIHNGVENFTIGQRRGLGIAAPQPLYVVRLDVARNIVYVAERENAFSKSVSAGQINTLAPDLIDMDKLYFGKIRSGGEPQPCRITSLDSGFLSVEFDEPVFGVAGGQHLVLYDEQERLVIGGEIVYG